MPKIRAVVLATALFASIVAFVFIYAGEARSRVLLRQTWSDLLTLVQERLGPKNTCPICGERSVFRTAGRKPRPRGACTVCGSLERHRLLYLYLEQKTDLFEAELSVLHFSPVRGLAKALKAKQNLNYVVSEYDRPADLQLDLTDLALPDDSWDVLICYHVLEHITEDRKAMSEMYRVLKPGGWAVVQVPVREQPDSLEDPSIQRPEQREQMFGQHDHVRYYGWKDFADRLEQAGFEVTIERFGRGLSDELVREYSVFPDERIYLLRKPESLESEPRSTVQTDAVPPVSR